MATYGQGTEHEAQQLNEEVLEGDTPDENLSQHHESTAGTGSAAETNPATNNSPAPSHAVAPSPQTMQPPMTFQSPPAQDVEMHDESFPELHHHLQHHHINAETHTSPSIVDAMQATEDEIMQAVENISPGLFHDFAVLSPTQTRQSFASPDKTDMTPSAFYNESTPFTPSAIPIAYASPGVLYTERPVWPLKSAQEAQLMRFFVDRIAPAIDLCDRDRHFALVVPQRASQCPILLNAVFAASARHLSTISDFDPIVSNKYNQECLKHLIPKLSDAEAIMDENLLAATVILRHLEELESRWTLFTDTTSILGVSLISVCSIYVRLRR